jgi:hypothetical protein
MDDAAAVEAVRQHAIPLDLDTAAGRVLELIDPGASVVLIGEATLGTLPAGDLPDRCLRIHGFDDCGANPGWTRVDRRVIW